MLKLVRISSALAALSVMGAVCYAQSVTSARSGTLHYFEGDVSIDGTPVQSKVGKFPEVKEQGVLSTALGRAEVLLTPGVFLRLGENSSIKMLDTRLISTRVDILSGNVMLESDDPQMDLKDSPVVVLYKGYEIRIRKHGLIELNSELNSDPGKVKVFKGEALVELASGSGINNRAVVKEGKMLPFSAALLTEKFDDKVGDDLYLWARDRSQVMSAANMSSARSLSSGYGTGYGALSSGLGGWNGGWYFNPFFDMYTYVPLNGAYVSPFGFGLFSPATIYGYYAPGTYWYGAGGPVGASAGGRPVFSGIGTSTNGKPAPIGQLLNSNVGRLAATGSPMRGGVAVGGQGFNTSMPAAVNNSSAPSAAGSFSARGGGVSAAPSGGGASTSGGGGGGMHGGGHR
jgi:hypothetical protein